METSEEKRYHTGLIIVNTGNDKKKATTTRRLHANKQTELHLLTKMGLVKHPSLKSIKAQPGLEF